MFSGRFFVYPCVVNKKGCGERDLSAVKKAEQLSKERIGEFHKNIISFRVLI